jgi:hypothetical protein
MDTAQRRPPRAMKERETGETLVPVEGSERALEK